MERKRAKEIIEGLLKVAEELCAWLDYELELKYVTTCTRIPRDDVEEVLRWLSQ